MRGAARKTTHGENISVISAWRQRISGVAGSANRQAGGNNGGGNGGGNGAGSVARQAENNGEKLAASAQWRMKAAISRQHNGEKRNGSRAISR